MAEERSSPYKSSTPEERFVRQLDRDLSRNSKRLSQSTIRALITNDTAQWANAIYNQKLAQNNANNSSAQQTSSATFATTQTSQTSSPADIGSSITTGSNTGSSNASADTIGEIPLPPESGTWVLGSIDGAIQWIETEDC